MLALWDWGIEVVSSRSRRNVNRKGERTSLPHFVTAKFTLTFVIWIGLMKGSERSFRLQKGLESVSQITQQRGHRGFQSSVITRHNKYAGAVRLPQEGKNYCDFNYSLQGQICHKHVRRWDRARLAELCQTVKNIY